MLERVRAASQGVRLRVGYAPSLASASCRSRREFCPEASNARVELFDLSTKEMLTGLENDTLDAVLTVGLDRDAHGFKWTQLIRASWRLAVNHHHPLARKARVTPRRSGAWAVARFLPARLPGVLEHRHGLVTRTSAAACHRREYDGCEQF